MKKGIGIWKFSEYFPFIPQDYRITLGEGNTELKKIKEIYFKCEYQNPTGAVKDRGMAYQISKAFQKHFQKAVISSSGNAAISASNYCNLAGIKLYVFVSTKINPKKLTILKKQKCNLFLTEKPISSAFKFAKENNATDLRGSKDPNAYYGFSTIAFELIKEAPEIDAVFIPVSSGTTMVGIVSGFKKMGKYPAFHIIQTEFVHPIASIFDNDFQKRDSSLADAIVAKFTPRESNIVDLIRISKGFGWVISDKEILIAHKWLRSNNLECSYEGAATLSGLWKAKLRGYKYKNPVCILTGKNYK